MSVIRGLLCAGMVLFSAAAIVADEYTLVEEQGRYLDVVSPAGKKLLRYVFVRDRETKESTFDTAKVFAHVFARDGETKLTKGPGGKFPHHRGIFIGWNKLKHGGKQHDLWHVRNTEQRHQAFTNQRAGEEGAEFTSVIDWKGVDGDCVLVETRTHRVTQADDGLVVDFKSRLEAVDGEVELNGDPEHAGIQFRPSQRVAENKSARYTFHADAVDPKKDLDLPWVAESFEMDGHWWNVQHLSHPSNPSGARWSAYRDYGRFGPFTVANIADGDSLTFQYRFVISPGKAPDRDVLKARYEAYVTQVP